MTKQEYIQVLKRFSNEQLEKHLTEIEEKIKDDRHRNDLPDLLDTRFLMEEELKRRT